MTKLTKSVLAGLSVAFSFLLVACSNNNTNNNTSTLETIKKRGELVVGVKKDAPNFGLLNPKLCTIELAKKVIPSKRYALAYLNDFLSIHTPVSHRAYADALTSLKIFNIATMMFPPSVRSMQDLIDFSKGRVGYK